MNRQLVRYLWVSTCALGLFCAGYGFAEEAKVEVGKKAPDVTLPATSIEKALPDKKDATTLSLKDFQGKKNVVLYFYPRAMTPGCTVESCGFRDKIGDFSKLDTVVIGIKALFQALPELSISALPGLSTGPASALSLIC